MTRLKKSLFLYTTVDISWEGNMQHAKNMAPKYMHYMIGKPINAYLRYYQRVLT